VLPGNLHGAFLGGGAAAMSPCYPTHSNEWQSIREGRLRLLASERSGTRVDDTGNRCELLINVVKTVKSKMLIDLNQKVSGMGEEFFALLSQTMTPPANR
jgi:hypothetical protein